MKRSIGVRSEAGSNACAIVSSIEPPRARATPRSAGEHHQGLRRPRSPAAVPGIPLGGLRLPLASRRRAWSHRPTSTKRASAWPRPRATGATGSTGRGFRTIASALSPSAPPRAQRPHVHADRRDRRCTYDVTSRDAGRRAQLGLPLRVDARFDLHASGAALADLDWEADEFMQFVPTSSRVTTARCRSCTRSTAGAH
jgi:hypothetical protein